MKIAVLLCGLLWVTQLGAQQGDPSAIVWTDSGPVLFSEWRHDDDDYRHHHYHWRTRWVQWREAFFWIQRRVELANDSTLSINVKPTMRDEQGKLLAPVVVAPGEHHLFSWAVWSTTDMPKMDFMLEIDFGKAD